MKLKKKKASTVAKSRTIARSALQHKCSLFFKRVFSFLIPVGYIFAVLVLFQFFAIQFVLSSSESSYSADRVQVTQIKKTTAVPKQTIGLPVRLKIPTLRVNAAIRYVGLTADGAMGIPKLPSETAWYMLGPKPGEEGSAAIAGHINWYYGAVGVFARLNTLKPGDIIVVEDDVGALTSFVVRRSRLYGLKEDASDVFRSADGKSHLNLITCDGVWNRTTKVYSKRLVVFADKVVK